MPGAVGESREGIDAGDPYNLTHRAAFIDRMGPGGIRPVRDRGNAAQRAEPIPVIEERLRPQRQTGSGYGFMGGLHCFDRRVRGGDTKGVALNAVVQFDL